MLIAAAGAFHSSSAVAAPPGNTLGVYAGGGNVAGATLFSNWLGRKPAYALDFLPQQSWSDITSDWVYRQWTGKGYQMIFSVPMLPASGASLAQGATGAYNAYFTRVAQNMVATGHGTAIVRLGWEMNGDWFAWSIKNGAAEFAAYWRQIVTTMRAVAPGLRFDYSTNNGSSTVGGRLLDPAASYPGDAYVDIIGQDIYDQSWVADKSNTAARWANLRDQAFGLTWHASFAQAHGKPMSFPEWGVWAGGSGYGGGDNADFIRQMHAWISATNVSYHVYFNFNAQDGDHLLTAGQFPKSAATFKELFGPLTAAVAPPPPAPAPPVARTSKAAPKARAARAKTSNRAKLKVRRVLGRGAKGKQMVSKLSWTNISGRVTVKRNGTKLRTTRRSSLVDRKPIGEKLTYKVCRTGTDRCSTTQVVRN